MAHARWRWRTPARGSSVLGGLATGYGVRRAIIETLGHFWHESFGQIYPTLAALEEDELVERDADGRFTITGRGRDELASMLAEEPEATPPRNGLLLRNNIAARSATPSTERACDAGRREFAVDVVRTTRCRATSLRATQRASRCALERCRVVRARDGVQDW